MRRTLTGLVVTLALLAGGCSGDDDPGTKSPPETTAPTATPAPTPDVRDLLSALSKDALAIDPRSEVVRLGGTPDAFEDTLYDEETRIAGRGRVYMPATLAIRYPRPIDRERARQFLRLFEKHGFDTGLTYDAEDFLHGQVQRGDDLRCRLEQEPRSTWLRCVPREYFEGVEWDVAQALTSLYSEETGDKDINLWEVLYPYAYGIEPPVGAILHTGLLDRRGEFRAYLYRDDAWELAARSRTYQGIGRAFGQFVCAPEKRGLFPPVCPGTTV